MTTEAKRRAELVEQLEAESDLAREYGHNARALILQQSAITLADMQRRVEELEGANKVITESHKWLYGETQRLERSLRRIATAFPGWTSERMGHIRNIARQALSDKTQEKNNG